MLSTNPKTFMENKKTLFAAVNAGRLDMVQQVINKIDNADERKELINSEDSRYGTILHSAVAFGRGDIIEWIFSEQGGRAAGFDKVHALAQNRYTALHFAAQKGDLEACKVIVNGCRVENGERGKVLSDLDGQGWTVLHFAAMGNKPTIIAWLLSQEEGGGAGAAGFNRSLVTALTIVGSSVLHLAARSGIESIQALLSHCTQEEKTNLFLAVDKNGWTVLHYAAKNTPPMFIDELLQQPEYKLIANRKDNLGMTVLHRAIIGGLDEKSKNEWAPFGFKPSPDMIAALLGSSEKGWTSIDPNIGVGKE